MKDRLFKSAIRGDIVQLEKVLKKSTLKEINEKEKGMGLSTLAFAVLQVQVESVRLLLKYGADPNSVNKYGQTPLFDVGERQPVDHDTPEQRNAIASLLLDAGADIHHCDSGRCQPLWKAVFYCRGLNDLPLIKLFLEKGANPNHINNGEMTPLAFAKRVGFSPLIELLENKTHSGRGD